MRRLRYSVAISLDGFIADVSGGYDWIAMDPDIDFAAMMREFDALLMGRRTYEVAGAGGPSFEDVECYVASTTLAPEDHPAVTIVSEGLAEFVTDLKARDGKDIWLFGGGVLFRSMLEAGLVDRVEVGVIPVLLGSGIPMLGGSEAPVRLALDSVVRYPHTGTIMLSYDVVR